MPGNVIPFPKGDREEPPFLVMSVTATSDGEITVEASAVGVEQFLWLQECLVIASDVIRNKRIETTPLTR